MLSHVRGIQFNRDKTDDWLWKGDESGQYTIKSAYMIISHNQTRHEKETYIKLCDSIALLTIIFCWRVFQDKIATI